MVQKVCVVGAGIIGLSSAVCIQEHVPNVQVTIIAEQFSPNVVSDVAAGFIQPYLCPESSQELILRWCRQTIDHIKEYMKECPNGGAQEMSGYVFQGDDASTPFWSEIMPNFRRLTSAEVEEKHPLPQKAGFFFTTYYLQPTKHIIYLMKKFKSRGGKCIQQKITALSDVGNDWDVVVNCTGLGARFLIKDTKLYPVRGQIIRARAPQVKHFFIDDKFYVLLSDDCVILGGTKEEHQWNLKAEEKTAQRILAGNRRNVPALEGLEIISHAVGLRPYRETVRLEREEMTFEGRKMPVIHNYGHGGSGVTLCWGCARDVAHLVKKELSSSKL